MATKSELGEFIHKCNYKPENVVKKRYVNFRASARSRDEVVRRINVTWGRWDAKMLSNGSWNLSDHMSRDYEVF